MLSRFVGSPSAKPSNFLQGRRWGVISFADSLDTVGIIASRVRDVRRIFGQSLNKNALECTKHSPSDAASFFDHKDPTSIPEDLRAQAQVACRQQVDFSIRRRTKDLKGLRIGVPQVINGTLVYTHLTVDSRSYKGIFSCRTGAVCARVHSWGSPKSQDIRRFPDSGLVTIHHICPECILCSCEC